MIDIKFVQNRLNQVEIDNLLPLRSWVRDLITDVRKFEKEEIKYKLAIAAYKHTVADLQDRMMLAVDAFDEDDFVTGIALLRHEVDKNEDQ